MIKLGYHNATWFVLIDGATWAWTQDINTAFKLRLAIGELNKRRSHGTLRGLNHKNSAVNEINNSSIKIMLYSTM